MRISRPHMLFAAALLLAAGCGETGDERPVSPSPGCDRLDAYFHVSAIVPSRAASAAVRGDLLYIADADVGLRIFDTSDPLRPSERGSVDTTRAPIDVDVDGNTVYVAWGRTGLVIVDAGNPDRPVITGAVPTPGGAVDVAARDGFAYVADDVIGLVVIDARVPDSARVAGVENTPGEATAVAIAWPLALVSDAALGVRVVNVEDPSSPWLVDAVSTPGTARGIATAKGYAYVADGPGQLHVLDPFSPGDGIIATVGVPGEPAAAAAEGDLLFVVDRLFRGPPETALAGLEVFDISDPLSPVGVNRNETSGFSSDVFAAPGVVVTADGASGVRVTKTSNPAPPPFTRSSIHAGEYVSDVLSHGGRLYFADSGTGLGIAETIGLDLTVTGYWPEMPGARAVVAIGDTVFVADGQGVVAAVDVSVPSAPVFAYAVPASMGAIAMSVYDNVLYMARGLSGLSEFVTQSGENPRGVTFQAYATASARYGDFVYVSTRQGSFVIVGASTMDRIGTTREYGAGEDIVIRVEDDPFLPRPRAFVAITRGDNGPGVAVVDVLTGSFPKLITHIPTSTAALALAFERGFMYVALGNGGLEVFAVDDLDEPRRLGYFPAAVEFRGVATIDGGVFVSDGSEGVVSFPVGECVDR